MSVSALKIHVSPCTKELLDDYQTFVLELRGPVTMKVIFSSVTLSLQLELILSSKFNIVMMKLILLVKYMHVSDIVCVRSQGKGDIITWWLTGENNTEFPDLAPPDVNHESNNSETDKCEFNLI